MTKQTAHKSCSVEALYDLLCSVRDDIRHSVSVGELSFNQISVEHEQACAVRALVEAKCREALFAGTCAEMDFDFNFEATLSRILGAP